ncbi:MAG: hypothetical protein A2855_01725 [Candidatus Liptonbacteria bacterium RIFCSPHIGHO2_01_FULL_57_28]|uniref:FCP1 homology domain-containing protein n=1 Tax=Candidatus Liptonbacteria bacterium RIFCSPHIGHO2_01_FULL_57_28 TaxID=1798647 RepID=A0A1G2CAD9_9BACT|nr:MAG: hypothetical protein A2855_01725 [Candidatus Liptonbacteria bacterium RIFCSPHIGHO2_01_FULL_57_28]
MKPGQFLIVFDWDGVVFDTMPIRKIRNKLLKKLGYSDDHIFKTSRKAVESRGGYNFYSHARLLMRSKPKDSRALANAIHEAVEKHPSTFVFPDARRTISILKRSKRHFDILTAGHAEFQEYKIMRSGLRSMFRSIHVVQSGPRVPHYKFGILKKLARSHKQVIFLDDRADTIRTIRRSFELRGKVLPVLVWRGKEQPPRGLPMLRRLSWKGIREIAIHNGFRP